MGNSYLQHYLDLIGIQTWRAKTYTCPNQVKVFRIMKNGTTRGVLVIQWTSDNRSQERYKLIHAIAKALHCDLDNGETQLDVNNRVNSNNHFTILMGQINAVQVPGERLLRTISLDELLLNPIKKRIVWHDIKSIAND